MIRLAGLSILGTLAATQPALALLGVLDLDSKRRGLSSNVGPAVAEKSVDDDAAIPDAQRLRAGRAFGALAIRFADLAAALTWAFANVWAAFARAGSALTSCALARVIASIWAWSLFSGVAIGGFYHG